MGALLPDLSGRVAVVTASGGMMGAAIAMALARRAARVALNDRVPGRSEQVRDDLLAAGHDALAVTADVSTPDGAGAVFDAALGKWSCLDILVNVAGGLKRGRS